MKVPVVGSIKIDSYLRKRLFILNLEALKTVSGLFSWNFNMVGKYAPDCALEIKKRYPGAVVTHDNASSYYQVVKSQVDSYQDPDTVLFFLQEDHWLVCPHKNLFLYLLREFAGSKAQVLRMTHLTEFWEKARAFKVISENELHKEYLMDTAGYQELLGIDPLGYITSLPGIFKKSFVSELLENNKSLIDKARHSVHFELYGQKAREFLAKRSFITMAPTFHVLREVFLINQEERAMDAKKALAIITLRDGVEKPIAYWRKAIRMLAVPRVLAGNIKRLMQGGKS